MWTIPEIAWAAAKLLRRRGVRGVFQPQADCDGSTDSLPRADLDETLSRPDGLIGFGAACTWP
jgi:hypothetical protein